MPTGISSPKSSAGRVTPISDHRAISCNCSTICLSASKFNLSLLLLKKCQSPVYCTHGVLLCSVSQHADSELSCHVLVHMQSILGVHVVIDTPRCANWLQYLDLHDLYPPELHSAELLALSLGSFLVLGLCCSGLSS